jgi:hypothetical protein
MKSFRATWVFIAVVVGLAGWTFYEYKHASEDLDRDQGERQAFTFKREDLDTLRMTAAGQTAELTRSGDAWKIVKPVDDMAESSAVEGFLYQLLALKLKVFRDDDGSKAADWAKYGLQPPKATIEIGSKGKMQSLAISTKNAFDGSFYVRLGDELLLGDPGLAQIADRPGSSFRSRRLWRDDDANVEHATVELEKEKYTLVKEKDGWALQPKPSFPLNKDKIGAFIEKIQDFLPSEIVKEGIDDSDKSQYLLKKPFEVITFDYKNKAGKDTQWTLTIGQSRGDEYFVYTNLRPTIYKATKAAAEKLHMPPAAFRDGRTPFQFPVEQAREVRVHMDKFSHTFKKNDSGWALADADNKDLELEQEKLVQLFQNIRNLDALEFAAAGQGIKGPPQIEILGDKGILFTLAWGDEYKAKSPWNAGATLRPVKTNLGGKEIAGLPKDKLEKLVDATLVRKKAPAAAKPENMSTTGPEKK